MGRRLKRVRLFLAIVWRKNQDYCLGIRLAWDVSGIVHRLEGK